MAKVTKAEPQAAGWEQAGPVAYTLELDANEVEAVWRSLSLTGWTPRKAVLVPSTSLLASGARVYAALTDVV